MTQTDGPEREYPATRRGARRSGSWLALALGVAAVVAPAVFYLLAFPVLVLFVLGGVAAVVLAVRAWRRGQRGVLLISALVLGAVGALVNTVLIVVAVVLLTSGPVVVELRTEGGPEYTIQYETDDGTRNDAASTSMVRLYVTTGSSAYVTAMPPAVDDRQYPYTCTILWDGVVVAAETSTGGPVTCAYDRN